jgi:hypothetical protein
MVDDQGSREGRDPAGPDPAGGEPAEGDPVGGDPAGAPAPGRTDKGDTRPTWLEILLPSLVVIALFVLALLWNIVAAIVVLIIGIGVILSWVIQRRTPHEPGE